MKKRRVVVTGMGSVSPYGIGNKLLLEGIDSNKNCFIEQTIKISKTRYKTFPIGLVPDRIVPSREIDRTMSNLSRYAYVATLEALMNAGITQQNEFYHNIGTAISSTLPSVETYEELFNKHISVDPRSMPSTISFKTMNHTSSLNIASALQLRGRCLSSSSACAGGLQSVALGYEAIAFNRANVMVCGGTEEYHPFLTLIFNKLGIASKTSCKPFDEDRDGIIISEGAGILVLEEYEHALSRNANILAEIIGVGINTSSDLAHSDKDSIFSCMRLAILDCKEVYPGFTNVSLINAHATGTQAGDVAEGKAIAEMFGAFPKVNSLKGYFGHTMAASGSLELIATILGLRKNNIFYDTKGCNKQDSKCGRIDVTPTVNIVDDITLMKTSCGLGGINTSLILKINNLKIKGE